MSDLFQRAADIAVTKIQTWLPGGYVENGQWVVRNPHRDDKTAGSLKINLKNGKFRDYADSDDCVGTDAVTLYAWLNGLGNYDAAVEILTKYDPSYFPGQETHTDRIAAWYQLQRGRKGAPELAKQRNEQARWPLEIKSGSQWRIVMWIVRIRKPDGGKVDYPYTLWTDSKSIEWRAKSLKNVKYPLYGLRALTDNPNARVVLYEGQKCAAIVQKVLGADWVCVGWYGGAGNSRLTDFEPLTGRDVYYSFDADLPGRKAIQSISETLESVHARLHLVYPPANVPKKWDHADAVEQGATKSDIEALLLAADVTTTDIAVIDRPEPGAPAAFVPDNRPALLSTKITQETREIILTRLYEETTNKDGDPVKKIYANWPLKIAELDSVIGGSIKFDYTTGIESTAYDNSSLYLAALEQRLDDLGISARYVTKTATEKIMRAALIRNSNFNRVLDYVDAVSNRYPNQANPLDNFMKLFAFEIQQNENENEEEYAKRCDVIEELYKELFDIFFTRMYGHLQGTRRIEGEYKGLFENDIVLILSGPQGCGKTTLCRWLACDDELYVDLGSGQKQKFGESDTVKKIRGKLLAEIGEMKALKSAKDVETIKSFVSQKSVNVDIKYVENQRQIPITCSYIGTDNDGQFLVDDSGNRRFWPIKIRDIDIEEIAKSDLNYRIAAFYAQKTAKMSKKDVLDYCHPSKELDALMSEHRTEAMVTYSDYEACCEVIAAWKGNRQSDTINYATVEKMAYEAGFTSRISQRSCKRALIDCGLVQKRRKLRTTGKYALAWVYNEFGATLVDDGQEEIPF